MDMGVCIAPMTLKTFRPLAVNFYYRKEKMKRPNRKKNNSSSIKTNSTFTFFQDVYDVVRLIPRGRVSTYGAIAAYLSAKSSARMVGWAMNVSHQVIPKVPAHRVVNRNGMLTGKNHFETPTLMEELLKKEKVFVSKNTVIDFENKFWDPTENLNDKF